MIFSLILISACFLSQVSSHGRVFSPITRQFLVNKAHRGDIGCYVNWDLHYLNGFKCNNVCGNIAQGSLETGEIDPRYEQTGPIQAVYKMGQTIEVKFDGTGHQGYFRFRLCKLSNPTDMVNQRCLDENLLELSNLNSIDMRLSDKYTIVKPNRDQNATVQVKLPDGLTCDNCVLQWEWITTISRNVLYPDGKLAPREYSINQVYKNCIDIKIEQDSTQSNQVYKPNPVESVYPKTDPKSHPPVYTMIAWPHMKMDANGKVMKPEKPDELAYKGSGLICFSYGQYIVNTFGSNVAFDNSCRVNCMSPEKICPEECACRWFNWL